MHMALFFTGVGIFVVTLTAVLVFASWERRRAAAAGKTEQEAMLPPGSMGLPYVGETLQLYSQNPNVFFATRQNR
jgi:(+)-abscisic acid 8'-hydroxylase